ncbi:MAG: hypothetical protein K2Y23_24110 [Cyanobacteria bacterium]|nr:hypothetical protein [Cyanobacteriota bacterium]
MKLFPVSLPLLGVLSLGACTVAPTPTSPSAAVKAETVIVAEGFDPNFYRAFLQNGFEAPDHLETIKILQAPLRIYLKTLDDTGRAVDAATLDSTERVLIDSARIWSGGTFGLTEVARGTATREKVSGWLTVKWASAPSGDRCGRSTIGVDGGYIELNASGACSCGTASIIYPRLVRHELGHAMGYYHTDSPSDVMYGNTISSEACDLLPSDRERRHAQIAHSTRE